MKLLLDEHFSPIIARTLRARGHDVVGVNERADLRARPDPSILAAGIAEGRVIVTADVKDFREQSAVALRRGVPVPGLVCAFRGNASHGLRSQAQSYKPLSGC